MLTSAAVLAVVQILNSRMNPEKRDVPSVFEPRDVLSVDW